MHGSGTYGQLVLQLSAVVVRSQRRDIGLARLGGHIAWPWS
jgi:hypothetical protein